VAEECTGLLPLCWLIISSFLLYWRTAVLAWDFPHDCSCGYSKLGVDTLTFPMNQLLLFSPQTSPINPPPCFLSTTQTWPHSWPFIVLSSHDSFYLKSKYSPNRYSRLGCDLFLQNGGQCEVVLLYKCRSLLKADSRMSLLTEMTWIISQYENWVEQVILMEQARGTTRIQRGFQYFRCSVFNHHFFNQSKQHCKKWSWF